MSKLSDLFIAVEKAFDDVGIKKDAAVKAKSAYEKSESDLATAETTLSNLQAEVNEFLGNAGTNRIRKFGS